ncbi:tetratricopeptide repeat protein [Geomonas sp. Red32]|uniref:tetratricopeptide repeat protein n=1 Tax=Geomonas sp. Red32 TaxID=2912856 RepID=UPI00202CE6AF|nr:tetratricopeptide repeat protein [Geomonas sp. Red32]MCM0080610.1 tetratricopeptide repeat protein [Geomonas sp. Red32]
MNNHDRKLPLGLAAIVLGTLLLYLPALGNGFVNLDDYFYVVNNPGIAQGGSGLLRFAFLSFHAELWIPLTWLSLALDHALWGLNPLGYHLTNVLFHAANSALAAQLAVRLVEAARASGAGREVSPLAVGMLAGAWFAVAPLHVESVAWVTERKDVLNGFFALASLLCYLRYAGGDGSGRRWYGDRRYWGSFILFVLSLMAKSMTVTLPLVLLLLDRYPLDRLGKGKVAAALVEKIPFFLASLAVGVLTVAAQAGTMQSFEFASPLTRVLVAGRAGAYYLWKLAWPSRLIPFHVHPGNTISSADPAYLLPLLLVVSLTAAAGWGWAAGRARLFSAAWLFFLATLFPVLGFSQSGPQAMADRFTYLPLLGPVAASSVAITRGVALCEGRGVRNLLAGLAALALVAQGAVTWRQIGFWRSTETLWSRVVEVAPNESGRAYFERGQQYVNEGAYAKALPDLTTSLEIARAKGFRNIHRIYGLRGNAYLQLGRFPEAASDYRRAIELAPRPEQEYAAGLAAALRGTKQN